jgi:hypothetical protein
MIKWKTLFLAVSFLPLAVMIAKAEESFAWNQGNLENILDIDSLSAFVRSPQMAAWGEVEAATRASGQPRPEIRAALDLYSAIQRVEAGRAEVEDMTCIRKFAHVYADLNGVLTDRGGSGNLAIGDTISRIFLSRSSYYLEKHPNEWKSVQGLFEGFPLVVCNDNTVRNLLEEFSRERSKALSIEETKRTTLLSQVLQWEGFPPDRGTANLPLLEYLPTSQILQRGKLSPLLFRLYQTTQLGQVNLPGLLDYLRRGGAIDRTRWYSGYFPEFESLMGESFRKYKFDYDGQVYLRPSDLLGVEKLFGESPTNNHFYQLAVQ